MATADLLNMSNKKTADKQKALDSALSQIERQFGKGSIMKLGGANPLADIEAGRWGWTSRLASAAFQRVG